MQIDEIKPEECYAFLGNVSVGRLACSFENQPYVVPIYFAYEKGYIYVFSTFGQKVKWMRANPKVCIQADEIQNPSEWISVIAEGEAEELAEPKHAAERQHATSLLAKRYQWWLNALGERQVRVGDKAIDPLFFRIRIQTTSGLRATDEKKS
ncbi:MAG: pyridoxamine 5'-phosphate oxidase family protein [Acidobacteriaceae bacterium]|nr:pyridoxamine 5'-phosphate oxidase family protein [Acidobacteriaceae bacterium]